MSEAELHDMMRDPRYWRDRDPEFIGRVTAGFRDLFEIAAGPAPEPSPAAEIAALRARVAELEASQARLAAFADAAIRVDEAWTAGFDTDATWDQARLEQAMLGLNKAFEAILPSDLAPETPHG